jgi:peptidoglycan/xylan/chitin deacetylase (PgdA/CDA1 family)
MSLSEPSPAGPDPKIWEGPLAPMPSAVLRVRSRALRTIAARVLPRSVLFAHGTRHTSRRRVALTFDDGPDPMTPQYLDALDELGARATFFVVGERVVRRASTVLDYIRRGHEVGGHGWTHEPFTPMGPLRLADELSRTDALLPRRPGQQPMVRPPRGILSARVLMTMASSGYATVLWSVDSDDCRTRDARVIERRLAPSQVMTGDVILLHEMQPWTLEALPQVIRTLRGDGYELVTVSQLMNDEGDERA